MPKHQLIGTGYGDVAPPPNEDCDCAIGEDHFQDGELLADQEALQASGGDDDESLSVDDASDIWLSKGMDVDYMFGYSESRLRRAAGLT